MIVTSVIDRPTPVLPPIAMPPAIDAIVASSWAMTRTLSLALMLAVAPMIAPVTLLSITLIDNDPPNVTLSLPPAAPMVNEWIAAASSASILTLPEESTLELSTFAVMVLAM